MDKILQYIVNRLREPSTYTSLTLVLTGIAHWATTTEPQRTQILMDIGLFIAGAIGACLPDRIPGNSRTDDASTQTTKSDASNVQK